MILNCIVTLNMNSFTTQYMHSLSVLIQNHYMNAKGLQFVYNLSYQQDNAQTKAHGCTFLDKNGDLSANIPKPTSHLNENNLPVFVNVA